MLIGGYIERGYAARMADYLEELFPLPGHWVFSILVALGILGLLATLQPATAGIDAWTTAHLAWNLFASLLIIRLMDELKDRDIDRALFPERPLPSGRVHESDIRFSLGLVIGLYVLANLGSLLVCLSALMVLGYSTLMYFRFFAPELLKRSLPITLATHTPVLPLIWLQGFVTGAESHGLHLWAFEGFPITLYIAMLWLCVLGWEVARKIRAAEEETAYVTYSQLYGRGGAVAFAGTAQTLALAIGIWLDLRFELGPFYLPLIGTGWIVCLAAYARFLSDPNRRTSKLKPYATFFIFCIVAAQVYGFVIRPL